MKGMITTLLLFAGVTGTQSASGSKPAAATCSGEMSRVLSSIKVVGGAVLFAYKEKKSGEKEPIRLLEGCTTLRHDRLRKITTIQGVITTLLLFAGVAAAQAATGDKPLRDNDQRWIEITTPSMKAMIEYMGGDTLFVSVKKEDQQKIRIRLMEANTTLFDEGLQEQAGQQKIYIISALPEGEYKIRLKKSNYVVNKTIIPSTPQTQAHQ